MNHGHLFLCGLRGAGKTSVGTILATKLKLPLLDLDRVIEADAGMTISEIFAEGGEQIFRDFETVALQTVSRGSQAVISLGGGAVQRKKNRDFVIESGVCVWLQASSQSLAARLAADDPNAGNRPALTNLSPEDEIETLLQQRTPVYRQVAHHTVDTDGRSREDVAGDIATWWTAQESSQKPASPQKPASLQKPGTPPNPTV